MSVELVTNQWHGSTIIFLLLVAVIATVLVVLILDNPSPIAAETTLTAILFVIIAVVLGSIIVKNGNNSPEELAQETLTNIEEAYGVNLSTPVSNPIEDLSNSPIDVTISFSNTGQSPVAGAILVEDGRASVFVKEQGVLVPANDYITKN